jgi:hypothetical protein
MTTATNAAQHTQSPAAAFANVLDAAVSSAATGLQRKAQEWTDKLHGVADRSGAGSLLHDAADEGLHHAAETGDAKQAAGAEGLRAELRGKNPFWAAIKGAWNAGSPAVRAAIITAFVAMVPLLLLSPVLLLVYLLSWLVIAAVMRSRSAKKS